MTTARETTYKYIRILINKGMLAEAEELLEQVLAESPEHLDALFSLGAILAHRGDTHRLKHASARSLPIPPMPRGSSTWPIYSATREKLPTPKRFTGRRLPWSQVSLKHSTTWVLCRNQGRLEEAAGYFRQALALDPDYLTAKVNLASSSDFCSASAMLQLCLKKLSRRIPNVPPHISTLAILCCPWGMLKQQ